jgi:hypothetical protein
MTESGWKNRSLSTYTDTAATVRYTWDDRTVAWWDDADDTWYLSTEVDVITPFLGPLPKKEGELSEEKCFQLMTLGRY